MCHDSKFDGESKPLVNWKCCLGPCLLWTPTSFCASCHKVNHLTNQSTFKRDWHTLLKCLLVKKITHIIMLILTESMVHIKRKLLLMWINTAENLTHFPSYYCSKKCFWKNLATSITFEMLWKSSQLWLHPMNSNIQPTFRPNIPATAVPRLPLLQSIQTS